ncbi:MAG: chromosomal replication initiator DnaA [Alphaproteobacteria bacterium]|nr:MAG: chromosomal replication initiator DnaA [Alphaproteobacteria bacterium]
MTVRIDTHHGSAFPDRPYSAREDAGLADVLALISREKSVPIRLLVHISRCRAETARARQLAMYLAHVVKGISLTAIGAAFGRDRTTVSYACGLIEDLRDDPKFDAELDRLEAELLAVGGARHD